MSTLLMWLSRVGLVAFHRPGNPDDPREGPICTELPGHIVFRYFARFRLGDLGACVATEESPD